MPPRPEYFPLDAQINRVGAPALSELPDLASIPARELQSLLNERVIALDVRSADEFASGHVPGSVNIPLSGQFASWAGIVLGLSSRPVLIAASRDQISEARTRLARVGIDDARGYLENGLEGWTKAGLDNPSWFGLLFNPDDAAHELERLRHEVLITFSDANGLPTRVRRERHHP